MRLPITVALLALAAPSAGAAADPKDAAQKLEGTYEIVGALIGGKPNEPKGPVPPVKIQGHKLVFEAPERSATATFVLAPTKTPAHIDLVWEGGKDAPGIYEVKETNKGLELTLAFAKGGKGERPKDFEGEGETDVVLKLLRKKAK